MNILRVICEINLTILNQPRAIYCPIVMTFIVVDPSSYWIISLILTEILHINYLTWSMKLRPILTPAH